MKTKTGGGGHQQLYDPSNGRYVSVNSNDVFETYAYGRNRIKTQREDELHNSLLEWVNQEMIKLKRGMSNREIRKFNTATIVYDYKTGKKYFGRNGWDQIEQPINEELNRILKPITDSKYLFGNCAEVQAINSAMIDGSELKYLRMITINTYKGLFGKYKQACESCTEAFKGRISKNYSGWSGEEIKQWKK